MINKRFPNYPDDTDYTTNAPSYYEDLARKEKLIRLLAERIWGYEEILDETLEEIQERFRAWDKNLEDFPDDVKALLEKWLDDGTLDHIINETIFNWKLDTSIFEQFRDSVTTQLAETISLVEDIAVNVRHFGAVGDGVTDDSQAVKEAIRYMCSKYKPIGESSGGWKSYAPYLYFPSGKYRITEPGTLNAVGGALQGYNIKGSNYMNTEIFYDYQGDEYLLVNGGNNWFGFSYIEDIMIRGLGTNNFWKITSQGGSPQANRFKRVGFFNLNEAVTVDFGTNNFNADLFRFESCKSSGIYGWLFGVPGTNNSQSVVHSFHDCDFEGINGTIIYMRSGGAIEVRGGSWIMNKTGRAFNFDDIGGIGIGYSNNTTNVYGTKFEYQYYDNSDSSDYHPLLINRSRMGINFFGCNFNQFQFKGTNENGKANYIYINEMGSVNFNYCRFPNVFAIKIKTNLGSSLPSPSVTFDNCNEPDDLNKIIILENENYYQAGSYPTVFSVNSGKRMDTQLFQQYGFRKVDSTKKLRIVTQSNNPMASLPAKTSSSNPDKTYSFKLPVGAIVTRISILMTKIADGNRHDITVIDDSNGEVLVRGNKLGTESEIVVHSDEILRIISSSENQSFTIKNTNGVNPNGGIGGFVAVEYY